MTTFEMNVHNIRKEFPILQKSIHGHPFIYLDSAATAQKPTYVIEAMQKFMENEYGTVHRAVYTTAATATEAYERARIRVQEFLNAKRKEEIIFTKGTTEGINLIASSFAEAFIKPGDEIIITEMEHHSNIVPWQFVSKRYGAHIRVVPFLEDGTLDLDAYQKLLSHKTKIVACTHVSNVLGTINPIQLIAKMAHEYGAKVVIDGAQSAVHMAIDVQAEDIDFYVFSGHKVYGPTGVGVVWGKYELLDLMPPYQGGGNMIESVTFEKSTYTNLPFKFEAGTPMICEVIGLDAALSFLMNIGMENICKWEEELFRYAKKIFLEQSNIRVFAIEQYSRAPIFSFHVPHAHPLDIATLCDLQGIAIRSGHLCAQPIMKHYNVSQMLRISLAIYNTKEEIDQFFHEVQRIIKSLTS